MCVPEHASRMKRACCIQGLSITGLCFCVLMMIAVPVTDLIFYTPFRQTYSTRWAYFDLDLFAWIAAVYCSVLHGVYLILFTAVLLR